LEDGNIIVTGRSTAEDWRTTGQAMSLVSMAFMPLENIEFTEGRNLSPTEKIKGLDFGEIRGLNLLHLLNFQVLDVCTFLPVKEMIKQFLLCKFQCQPKHHNRKEELKRLCRVLSNRK
jgi:hypothetical protein